MISVRRLVKRFGDRAVLNGIDLTVEAGETVAVMGSSGGGKTTLLRCISGLVPASDGEIVVDGVDVIRNPEEARRHMGLVFQSAALFDYLNVRENVLFGFRRHRRATKAEQLEACEAILEQVGLTGTAELMPSELSGGMRKRVGVARALILEPKVMLYDEPTTGLDPVTTHAIDRLIVEVGKSRGVTSLVVSHDLTSVSRVADRIAFLHAGELIFEGTPKAFLASTLEPIAELVEKTQATSLEH